MKFKFNNKDDRSKSAFIGYISNNSCSDGVDRWNDLANIVAWYHAAHDGDDIDTFLDDVLVGVSESGELIQTPKDD